MRNPTGTWIVVVGDGNAEPRTVVSDLYLDPYLNSIVLLVYNMKTSNFPSL